eukprot:c19342_g1_i1 orf=90-260(-)
MREENTYFPFKSLLAGSSSRNPGFESLAMATNFSHICKLGSPAAKENLYLVSSSSS